MQPLTQASNSQICVICQDDDNPIITINKEILNCSHIFHNACIGQWLMEKNNCPICRACVHVNTRKAPEREMTNDEILEVSESEGYEYEDEDELYDLHYDLIFTLTSPPSIRNMVERSRNEDEDLNLSILHESEFPIFHVNTFAHRNSCLQRVIDFATYFFFK